MAFHNISTVREQLRAEILSALANASAPMTTGAIYKVCPSAENSADVSRLAWDLKRKGLIADGGKVTHPRGSPVNSYVLATPADPRIEAAKPIKPEPKIRKSRQPAIKRKPAPGHPFAASIRPQEAHDALPRTTRPLPIHLTTPAPQRAIEEAMMSEDPTEYVPDPDAFILEPPDPEAEEDMDGALVDALIGMSDEMFDYPIDPVGEITAAMERKNCQCAKIDAPPRLPSGLRYKAFGATVHSEWDDGCISLETLEDRNGMRLSLNTNGEVSFSMDEIGLIPEVASFLNALHVSE